MAPEIDAPDLTQEGLIPIPHTYVVHFDDIANLIADNFPGDTSLREENGVM